MEEFIVRILATIGTNDTKFITKKSTEKATNYKIKMKILCGAMGYVLSAGKGICRQAGRDGKV